MRVQSQITIQCNYYYIGYWIHWNSKLTASCCGRNSVSTCIALHEKVLMLSGCLAWVCIYFRIKEKWSQTEANSVQFFLAPKEKLGFIFWTRFQMGAMCLFPLWLGNYPGEFMGGSMCMYVLHLQFQYGALDKTVSQCCPFFNWWLPFLPAMS